MNFSKTTFLTLKKLIMMDCRLFLYMNVFLLNKLVSPEILLKATLATIPQSKISNKFNTYPKTRS